MSRQNYLATLMQQSCFTITYASLYISTDNDECSETEGMMCDHICVNTIGSFFCSCEEGYKLNDDGYTCDGMSLSLSSIKLTRQVIDTACIM